MLSSLPQLKFSLKLATSQLVSQCLILARVKIERMFVFSIVLDRGEYCKLNEREQIRQSAKFCLLILYFT